MKINKYLFIVTALILASITLKSQEPEPSWELSLGTATLYRDYLPGNLLELKDGNYLIPLISTIDYRESSEKSCEAKILKISADGEIMDEKTLKYDNEYKLNDISVDIWNDTVNVFSHLIANDHTGSKIIHNYLFNDLTISDQKEIYETEFDTLMAAVYEAKRGNVPLINEDGFRTVSFLYISRIPQKGESEYDREYNVIARALFLKFDSRFNVVAEKWYSMEEWHFNSLYPFSLEYSTDSTEYYFMSVAYNLPRNSQYVLDMDLNYLGRNSYTSSPQGVFDIFYTNWNQNPYDGEMYGFGEVYTPWQDSELFIFKLHPDDLEAEYTICTNTSASMKNYVLPGENICFSPDGKIYGLGIYNYFMYPPYFEYEANVCYIGVFDKDINYLSEWYYQISPDYNHFFDNIYYTKSDDIIITGEIRHKENGVVYYEPYITKFPASAFVNIEEAHAHNLHLAVVYPNPGGDVMNIRTSLRDCTLQVYDMQGRMVHQQEITDDVTSVDASGWKSGTYVWELGMRNEELGIKMVEEGKWVKTN